MGSDLTIRPVKLPTDIARLRAFLVAEQDDLNIPTGAVATRLDEFLASAAVPWDVFLIAEVGGILAGFAIISTNRKFGPSHQGALRIQVGERHRGSGIGSALLTQALEWADGQGLVRITAAPYVDSSGWDYFVPESNGKVRFFTSHGFKLEGRARAFAPRVGGGFTDAVLMARVLL